MRLGRVSYIPYGFLNSCILCGFYSDNISDGMMNRETNLLANTVMNAFWFSEKYMPTGIEAIGQQELNPGKLARE